MATRKRKENVAAIDGTKKVKPSVERVFEFSIDRGGTFTDVYATIPVYGADGCVESKTHRVLKLLSVDPQNYEDAPREAIRRILEETTGIPHPQDALVDTSRLKSIRMGTTVATNALLERKGERTAFLTTKGFGDILRIGNQSRPHIFDLEINRPDLLYEVVKEVDERVLLEKDVPLDSIYNEDGKHHKPQMLGVTGEKVYVLKEIDLEKLRTDLQDILDKGITSVAVSLMHAYTYPEHEIIIGRIAKDMGFQHVSLSSQLMPMVKLVPRSFTSSADAYLTPCIQKYISNFVSGFDSQLLDEVNVSFMQSDGGLADVNDFSGFRAILSGPAGGVVGYAVTSFTGKNPKPVIGFDMGGTSTDVSRYAGQYDHVFETVTAGVSIQAPQLDINTVAAGGGSMLFFRSGMFVVGPESAGAHPGPACYRKGGPLTITDANLLLGRLKVDMFPKIFGPDQNEGLDVEATQRAFTELTQEINDFFVAEHKKRVEKGLTNPGETPQEMTDVQVAEGFIRVANEAMCRPIREITQAKGYSTSDHQLACFGGAGGQHACAIARALGMRKVYVHRYSGILSAFGIGLADVVAEDQTPCSNSLKEEVMPQLRERLEAMAKKARANLLEQGYKDEQVYDKAFLNVRYQGTDTSTMVTLGPAVEVGSKATAANFAHEFESLYRREYGFTLQRPIIVTDLRVRVIAKTISDESDMESKDGTNSSMVVEAQPRESNKVFFEGEWRDTGIYYLQDLQPGHQLEGPAMILNDTSTIVVEPTCTAFVTGVGDVMVTVGESDPPPVSTDLDIVQLSIFSHRFMSIAEQMGRTLQRTSISTNIKERLDFSCALFGPNGGLVANAPHLPVHLGAMQEAVRYQVETLGSDWKPGEVIVSNHPSAGGSHLPDITVITPVFDEGVSDSPVFFVASRGHHGDIGGISPGSMPPFSKFLYQEGAAIKTFKLVRNGEFDEAGITEILMNPGSLHASPEPVTGTRNLKDNLSDLKAQVAANQKGILLVGELIKEYRLEVVQAYMLHIQHNAELAVRNMLKDISLRHGLEEVGSVFAEEFMDDGSSIRLRLEIDRRDGSAKFDFEGTSPQVYGNHNAPVAITKSAIIYCLRCLVQQDIPLNQGCLNPIEIHIPKGTLLNPSDEAAVVGGNVLTSQRVTDVVLKAFQACAASQGCMNNFTFGDSTFGYYETIAGGAGAGPTWHGQSGVHTHMTNTRITDPEILERRYPVFLKRFGLRAGSGGDGLFRGGDGVERELQFLKPLSIGILSERRITRPYGLKGGLQGQPGTNIVVRKDGLVMNLGGKNTYEVQAGDSFHIHTPGGGGYGRPGSSDDSPANNDASASSNGVNGVPTRGSIAEYRRLQESA